jgi:hypothetical protein
MRIFGIILVCSLFAFSAHAQVEPAEPTPPEKAPCDTEKDEFTGKISIDCPVIGMKTEEHVGENLYQSRAILVRNKGVAALHFVFGAESWNFLDARTAYALIDGENQKWNLEQVATETQSGGDVLEDHAVRLNQSQLKALANSKTFRVKIKQSVFDLSDTGLSTHAGHVLRIIDRQE